MPHHMEYAAPPNGELLFMNAHHHEISMLVDVSDPRAPRVVKTFAPPAPLRYPHDYSRTPKGTRLVGFLRSEGPSPDPAETVTPGNHGGIAEYTADGVLLRTVFGRDAEQLQAHPAVRVRVSPRHRQARGDQRADDGGYLGRRPAEIYRYSDFTLLKTIDLLPGRLADGRLIEGSERAGFVRASFPTGRYSSTPTAALFID